MFGAGNEGEDEVDNGGEVEKAEDEGEGDKPLTMEEFIQKAMSKIESKKSLNTKSRKALGKPGKKK